MKKTIFIIIGSIVLFLVFSVWIYLLLFGAPKNVDKVFTDIGWREVANFDTTPITPRTEEIETVTLSSDNRPLTQLTTKAVAGYQVLSGISAAKLLYAERGTGHIYQIDFNNNQEIRLLGHTTAKTKAAYFSDDGRAVVLVAETETGKAAKFVTIPQSTEGEVVVLLPNDIDNVKLQSSTTVWFTKVVDSETIAYSYNRLTNKTNQLWRIPLTEINVWWNLNRTLISNKHSPILKGALYELKDGSLTPLSNQYYGYAVNVDSNSGNILETYIDNSSRRLTSRVRNPSNDRVTGIEIMAIPEKCAWHPVRPASLWCGALVPQAENTYGNFIRDWYMGLINPADILIEVTDNFITAIIVSEMAPEAGFVIDLTLPQFNKNGTEIFFINKINDALWRYRITSTN